MNGTGTAITAGLRFDDVLRLLPPHFRAALKGATATPTPGMGGASVFRISRPTGAAHYLKFACGPEAHALSDEIARTAWLSSRGVRVPEFVMTAATGTVTAGLMTAVPGRAPAHGRWSPQEITDAVVTIGRGLAKLHAVPAADCPFDEMPQTRLAKARHDIDRNLIDGQDFDDRNAVTPEVLYARLAATVPATEPGDVVVVHGDATLANLVIGSDLGFVDCGRAGRSDRYVDLAVVETELRDRFGRDAAVAFADAYGRGWDVPRAAFFRDLYELF